VAGGKIFVCYRRDDTAGDAGRLYDRLNQRFPGRVFMDVAGISLGTRWADVIEETMRSCHVAVILIGKRWLEPGPDGVRRLDIADDPTRGEIVTALRLGLKIVPLVVAGAAVPDRKQLPSDVAAITEWQAHRIDHEDFDHDATRLVRELELALGDGPADAGGAHRPDPIPPVPPVSPTGGRHERVGWFGLSFGSLKVWVTVGVAAMATMVVSVGALLDRGMSSGTPSEPTRAPVTQPPSPQPEAPPSLAGSYAMEAYSYQGAALPVRGVMRLAQVQPGVYQFNTQVTDQMSGGTFFYVGVLQGEGLTWATTTTNTNDPTAVGTPIVTEISFDGSRLTTRNAFGQAAIWRKQP
jgi:hypothetical protein